jgi:hypothetical protein
MCVLVSGLIELRMNNRSDADTDIDMARNTAIDVDLKKSLRF